jgi:uncharacterized membrane protein
MKRKTLMFLVILGFLLFIFAIFHLVGIWEEGAKPGFAQIVFITGVILGMAIELAIMRIEKQIPQ